MNIIVIICLLIAYLLYLFVFKSWKDIEKTFEEVDSDELYDYDEDISKKTKEGQ